MPLPISEDRRCELRVFALEQKMTDIVSRIRADQLSLRILRDDLKEAKAEWRAVKPNGKRRKVFS